MPIVGNVSSGSVSGELHGNSTSVGAASSRQCSRCRMHFASDEEVHPTPQPEWWLCPACSTVLLGKSTFAQPEGSPC